MSSISIEYHVGQPVIYAMPKTSEKPGPRAKNVRAAKHGDSYTYEVDKYWTIDEVRRDGTVAIRTRTGKIRVVKSDDRCLRAATWWERYWHRKSFPQPIVP